MVPPVADERRPPQQLLWIRWLQQTPTTSCPLFVWSPVLTHMSQPSHRSSYHVTQTPPQVQTVPLSMCSCVSMETAILPLYGKQWSIIMRRTDWKITDFTTFVYPLTENNVFVHHVKNWAKSFPHVGLAPKPLCSMFQLSAVETITLLVWEVLCHLPGTWSPQHNQGPSSTGALRASL